MNQIIARSSRLVAVFAVLLLAAGCASTSPSCLQELVVPPPPICPQPFDFAQRKTGNQYDLVFEGGGAKGTVFVGALQELEARGISGRRFVGTSAGAITATLLAAGYSVKEMNDAVKEKIDGKPRFATFKDIPSCFEPRDIRASYTYEVLNDVDLYLMSQIFEEKVDNRIFSALMHNENYKILFSFVERGGAYEGRKFLEWMQEKLNADCRNLGNATFAEFYNITQNDLTVVASDTAAKRILILNRFTAPQLKVAWAVRMSMSIPFFWQEVLWKEEWGEYIPYADEHIMGHSIVDGGVLSNFPLGLVVDKDNVTLSLMGNQVYSDDRQIGLIIDETTEVPDAPLPVQKNDKFNGVKGLKTVRRILNVVDTMSSARDNDKIKQHVNKVCFLPAKGYGTTEFDMSPERVDALIKAGKNAMAVYLDKNILHDGKTK